MTRYQIISQVKCYFQVKELVCNHTYQKWGEKSWRFLDTDYLHALLVIRRDILQSPMTCNHGSATQRGLRCNLCELVKSKTTVYLSGHKFGKAGDYTVAGMSAEEARRKIKVCAYMLPCPIRLEAGVNWLHFDTMPNDEAGENPPKVTEFTA